MADNRGASGNGTDNSSNGQRRLPDSGVGLLPAVEEHRAEYNRMGGWLHLG